VHRGSLKWGAVHTEKFWQENAYLFQDKDNMDLINILVRMLDENKEDKVKAIVCYDLGEFARFFAFGRTLLER
jgi:hypothetical protein